jgi:hypothetical protein
METGGAEARGGAVRRVGMIEVKTGRERCRAKARNVLMIEEASNGAEAGGRSLLKNETEDRKVE